MIPTLYSLSQALQHPDLNLHRLKEVKGLDSGAGIVRRSTMFAETEIEFEGCRCLMLCPLSPASIHMAERAAALLSPFRSEYLTSYEVLRNELTYADSTGQSHTTDIVLQRLPEGVWLNEALAKEDRERLLSETDSLERWLAQAGIVLNNIRPENIMVTDDGRTVPVRYHYAGSGCGNDAEAFTALKRFIYNNAGSTETLRDVGYATYHTTAKSKSQYLWQAECSFEQLRCVEDSSGFGFIDDNGNIVIPTLFAYASDFREGRAEVSTVDGKMGLIDKRGNYIIEPLYQIVELYEQQNVVWVRLGDKWGAFDYNGKAITKIDMDYVDENLRAEV